MEVAGLEPEHEASDAVAPLLERQVTERVLVPAPHVLVQLPQPPESHE